MVLYQMLDHNRYYYFQIWSRYANLFNPINNENEFVLLAKNTLLAILNYWVVIVILCQMVDLKQTIIQMMVKHPILSKVNIL
jgi:hypothetical protein